MTDREKFKELRKSRWNEVFTDDGMGDWRKTQCVNILYIQASGSVEAPYGEDVKEWLRLRETPRCRYPI